MLLLNPPIYIENRDTEMSNTYSPILTLVAWLTIYFTAWRTQVIMEIR